MDIKEEILNTEKNFYKKEEEPLAVEPIIKKMPATIINISAGEFILEDSNGNGIRMPIPKEYRNKKIGETIYL